VRSEEHQRILVSELNHRVRNMLTVVIALAGQTLAAAPDPALAAKAFIARLCAMSRAYNLLSQGGWHEVPLRDVVQAELEPFVVTDRKRVVVKGPVVQLKPKEALAFGLAVHELATNAAKYGALSMAIGFLLGPASRAVCAGLGFSKRVARTASGEPHWRSSAIVFSDSMASAASSSVSAENDHGPTARLHGP
jgi:HWE histidine kinase